MMASNNSSSMTKHHQEAASVARSYLHHHSGGGGGGADHGGGCLKQPPSVVQPSAAAASPSAVVCSYNTNNNGKGSGVSSGAGVLESSYNTSTATTRFQPNLHGISMDWTPDEQAILDEGLKTYAAESIIARYAKIAVLLKNKTVRDVALRYRWMTKRDFSRRRKDDLSLRKSKERKEKATDPSAMSSQALMQPAIDGVTQELLRQNARAFEQISANLATYQMHNNIGIFCQARDNISQILKRINEPPYMMKQMPALPVKVNEQLANSILPHSTHPMQ
ncbi:uncharacterized protein LOC113765464 [Coffea eugenioides]|uniref:uncharacterized protein LOC113765464 n=1 Tax=Coffea eugenioides TaxID=49369 RepID=UPI000F610F3F|nr:uncharacterized protein LOC113765464 [Coffea eugenioides]